MGWRFFERFVGVPPDIAAIAASSFGHDARFDALESAYPSIADCARPHTITQRADGSILLSGSAAGWPNGASNGEMPSLHEGYAVARRCALSLLTALRSRIQSLDEVERIVSVRGLVASGAGVSSHAAVIDGSTDLLVEVFGESGRAACSAIPVSALPGGAVVEIEMVVALRRRRL